MQGDVSPEKSRQTHIPKAPHIKRPMRLLRSLRQPALMAVFAYLLSFSRLFGIPSPFVIAMTVALGSDGESPLAVLAGACCALIMRLIWGIDPEPVLFSGCLLAALFRRFYYHKSDRIAALWTGLTLMPVLADAILFKTLAQQLLALASVAMGMIAAPAFCQALRCFKTPKEELGRDDRLCLLIIGGLILCGTGYLHLWRINLGFFLSCLITLCLSWSVGGSFGAAAGIFSGFALSLCGHGSTPILLFCTSGMASGLARRSDSRPKTALIHLLTVALVSLIDRSGNLVTHMVSSAFACVAFLLIKTSQLDRLRGAAVQVFPRKAYEENTYAGEMMRQWEAAIGEMAQSLPTIPDCDCIHLLEEKLCSRCELKNDCPEDDREAYLQALWAEFEQGADTFSSPCGEVPQATETVKETAEEMDALRLRTSRAKLEQAMIRTHLTAMSQAVRRLSAAAAGESLEDIKGTMEIERALKQSGFPAHLLYARRPGGHLQCVLESDTPAFTKWQPQRLLSDLWAHGGLSMEITQLERGRLHLEETPAFCLETGAASLALEEVNGDGILSMRFPGGRHMLALCDGMGHGPAAHKESNETLELLRLCLMADYTRAQAITAVNGMMLSATGGDRFATVDLWTIDLWNGLAQVEKLGACQSCLWRGDKPRLIEGAALPLGILENVTVSSRQIRLRDNDLILVFSDGIADAFADEDALCAGIARCVYQDPQRTADALLRQALIASGGVPRDDMTVLAARLTQWSAPAPSFFTHSGTLTDGQSARKSV